MNRSRNIGTKAETAVVRTARANGFPWADRLALHGRADTGDVTLCPGVIVEVKGGEAARRCTDLDVQRWIAETAVERVNARAAVGFLVVQRTNVGFPNAHRWHAYWRIGWLAELMPHSEEISPWAMTIARMTLGDSLAILRSAGYGDPLDEIASGE